MTTQQEAIEQIIKLSNEHGIALIMRTPQEILGDAVEIAAGLDVDYIGHDDVDYSFSEEAARRAVNSLRWEEEMNNNLPDIAAYEIEGCLEALEYPLSFRVVLGFENAQATVEKVLTFDSSDAADEGLREIARGLRGSELSVDQARYFGAPLAVGHVVELVSVTVL